MPLPLAGPMLRRTLFSVLPPLAYLRVLVEMSPVSSAPAAVYGVSVAAGVGCGWG